MRHFADWITAFQQYASFGEAPPDMYEWVGISTVAGALRRRIFINMGYFEWTPNLYLILTAPPGIISKSTTAAIGMDLLREIPGIKFGPQVVTWPALSQALAASTESFPDSDGVLHPMSAITIESSEFGNLFNPQDREMVDFFVTLWDAKRGTLTKMTKGSGTDVVVNPWLNLIACTTPAWIAGNFPEYMIGGGFTSRSIFVYGEKKHKYVAYPGLAMPQSSGNTKQHLLADLERISQLIGEVFLSPEAIQWGEHWYRNHYEHIPVHLNNERFGGYVARKQTQLHKLAMILSASQRDDLIIQVPDLERADALLSRAEPMMFKVFGKIGLSDSARKIEDMLSIARTAGPQQWDKLFNLTFRLCPDIVEYTNAVNAMAKAGYIRIGQGPEGHTTESWIYPL